MPSPRTIDCRTAAVAGVDLEHALNYILLSDTSRDFLYDKYTASRILYTGGSRPRLEALASEIVAGCIGRIAVAERIAGFVHRRLPHALSYRQLTGRMLPPDRNLTEEALLDSGYAWCNEQTRVFCALCQVCGIPARVVFIFMPPGEYGGGHVTAEVFTDSGPLAVDPSLGFCFLTPDRRPVAAADVWNLPEHRAFFVPLYREIMRREAAKFAQEQVDACFALMLAEQPLLAYSKVGFHNYYLL